MGSCARANPSIWNQWSIIVKVEQPASSAALAVAASVGPRLVLPPGSVKFMKWRPSSIDDALLVTGRVDAADQTTGISFFVRAAASHPAARLKSHEEPP